MSTLLSRFRGAALPPVLAVACLGAPAAGSEPSSGQARAGERVIASETARGLRVIVVASGSARRPRGLSMRVGSRPRQRVTGQWLVTCSKAGQRRTRRGEYGGRTTFRRSLPLPFARPRRCTVSASGQLSRRGRIRITLLAR